MSKLKTRIHDKDTGVDYILAGDYYITAIELSEADDRSIGKWEQMHCLPPLSAPIKKGDKYRSYCSVIFSSSERGIFKVCILWKTRTYALAHRCVFSIRWDTQGHHWQIIFYRGFFSNGYTFKVSAITRI